MIHSLDNRRGGKVGWLDTAMESLDPHDENIGTAYEPEFWSDGINGRDTAYQRRCPRILSNYFTSTILLASTERPDRSL